MWGPEVEEDSGLSGREGPTTYLRHVTPGRPGRQGQGGPFPELEVLIHVSHRSFSAQGQEH